MKTPGSIRFIPAAVPCFMLSLIVCGCAAQHQATNSTLERNDASEVKAINSSIDQIRDIYEKLDQVRDDSSHYSGARKDLLEAELKDLYSHSRNEHTRELQVALQKYLTDLQKELEIYDEVRIIDFYSDFSPPSRRAP